MDLLFLAVALLGVCLPIYLVRKSRVQDDGDGALRLFACPLLVNSSDHRLDAALRDAEEGYNRCKICDFESFKRFSSCSICGDSVIEPHAEVVDRIVRNTSTSINVGNSLGLTSRPGSMRGEPRSAVEIVMPHSTEQKQKESPTFTERQLRARKRKEWTRKLDIKGEVFWYRDGLHGAVDLRYPGFVAQFQRKRKRRVCYSIDNVEIDELAIQKYPSGCSSTDSMGEPEPALSPQSQLNSEYGEMIPPCKPSRLIMEQRVQELEDETLPTEIKLTDATVVDASRLSLDVALPPTKFPWHEILRVASHSFPAKYAHFVTSTAALVVPPEKKIIRFSLNRATLFKDSIESLSIIPAKNIRSVMRINFLDEAGIDAGGLHREWFVMLNEQLVDPKNGVFRCVNKCDQTFYFNSNSAHDIGENHLVYYFAAGRLVGRALLEGQVLGFHLALPLLKIVLGIPIAFTDLEYFDPELFKSLLWILENDGVDALGLDFSVTEKRGNGFVVVDLIRNGRNISVTDDNKDFYLERRFMHLLFESVSSQIYTFLKGLYEVIPQELLMLFDPEEFDYLLCGSDEIDVDDWEKHTQHSEELLHHPVLTWFWEIVREMPSECRRRLLQFATGSCRVPIAGFSALTSYDGRLCPFTLKGVPLKDDGYIWGHACFNRLDLPLHTVRDELRAVLYAAIETEMYGFTTN